jgi:hypothetical protein
MKCPFHTEFFDNSCAVCKKEYMELKRIKEVRDNDNKKYKEFNEDRAKKLYQELLLQYLRSGTSEVKANQRAKAIIKKQCTIRGIPFWPWL